MMKRILALAAAVLALAACNAVERITQSNTVYWHSDCHPDLWTTAKPDKATDGCNWTRVKTR